MIGTMESGTDISTLIGTVVAKRFRIESLIGAGAMGVVFRANLLDETRASENGGPAVALKIVLPDARQQRTVPRLLRGARLAAQVKHPHVVETVAHGRLGRDHDGYYVAMELVEGVSLGRLAAADLSIGALCTLMSQVLDALGHMHARAILHRDIKPDNILISRRDDGALVSKISDFGIASDTRTDATHLTAPGTLIGTPMYMAPEQMQGRACDTPSLDLYPIGVMLYELVSGTLPFPGHSLAALMAKLSEDPPPLAARSGLELPPGLERVIMRLLAREPADRYGFAADARRDLLPFCTPAEMSAERWRELLDWDGNARRQSSLELPEGWIAGWVAGVGALAAGTADPPAVDTPGEMPVVGRDDVLLGIEALADQAEAGEVRAAVLRGSVGMGKSALLEAAIARLGSCGRFPPMRARFHPSSSCCEPLRQAVDSALGTSGHGVLQVKQAIRDHLRRAGEEDPEEERLLLAFLRPSQGECVAQSETFALVHRYLRRVARARPALLAIDDLGYGGAGGAAFLDYLLFQGSFEPFPLMIVVTVCSDHRNEGFQHAFERSARFEGTLRRMFQLAPLDQDVLARALVAHLGLGQTQARRVARRAAGNPLYAVLMARAERASRSGADTTVEAGATAFAIGTGGSSGGAGTIASGTGSDSAERVPRVLREMLEVELRQQLERSNAPERLRALLEAVAILGTAVDVALLQAFLAEDETRHQLDDDLDRCLDLGLLQWSQQGKAEVVAFSPAVMRDVVLAGLNPRRARRLHGRAIDVRQVWAGAEVDAEAGALGDHCEAVGRMHEAVDWWLRGQRYEREGGDALLGLEWGRKALAALAPDDPRYAPCAIALGRTLLDAGELDQAAEVLLPVVSGVDADLAMQAGDVLADVYENRGSQEAWTRLIDTMSGREHEASDVGRTYLYIARAMWSSYYGTRSDALRDAERAVELAAPGEQAQRAAQRLAFQHVFEGDAVTAERHARRALEESGNRSDLRTRSLRLIGMVCEAMGRPEEALALHREALEICRRSGLTARIPIALVDIGDLMTLLDQSEDARARGRARGARAGPARRGRGRGAALPPARPRAGPHRAHLRAHRRDLQAGRRGGSQPGRRDAPSVRSLGPRHPRPRARLPRRAATPGARGAISHARALRPDARLAARAARADRGVAAAEPRGSRGRRAPARRHHHLAPPPPARNADRPRRRAARAAGRNGVDRPRRRTRVRVISTASARWRRPR
jgi:serine/threonine protein kinase/tetratricopeptide (TPR) repeat protein